MQTLVAPDIYELTNDRDYMVGGPLVLYVMERYGPKTFFQLYRGAHRDSFQDDCRTILGDSWQTVEKDFWKWYEREGGLLAETQAKEPQPEPAPHVELAKTVNAADWQAIVEGYREVGKNHQRPDQPGDPLPPTNAAFVVDVEKADRTVGTSQAAKRTHCEFRAVFEGERFWILENGFLKEECFLMATPVRDPELLREDYGTFEQSVRRHASQLLGFYGVYSVPMLPFLRRNRSDEVTYFIDRVVRPVGRKTGRWNVWFRLRNVADSTEYSCHVELDPEHCWRETRLVSEVAGGQRFEQNIEYQWLGDALVPVALDARHVDNQLERVVHGQGRLMSDSERQEFKQRVERAGPNVLHQRLRRLLLAIVIGCPVAGAVLLGITWRCKPNSSGGPR